MLRPAFSRQRTFLWFATAVAGLTVRTDLLGVTSIVRALGRPIRVIEKAHPAAMGRISPAPICATTMQWHSVAEADLWPVLWHSDLVVGMRSMALLEAALLGCIAVSYQPGLIGPDECTAVRLGVLPRLERAPALREWLEHYWPAQPGFAHRSIRRFPFATEDAARRVVDLALAHAEAMR